MPFKSRSQQRFMFAKHPRMAKEFAEKTDFEDLPEKVDKRKDAMKRKLADRGRG